MARQLEVGVGDDVVVVAPGADGSMGNDLYQVVGVFQTGLVMLDASYAVLPIADLQTLVVLDPGRIHEVAVSTADPWIAPETATRLSDALGPVAPRCRRGALDRASGRSSWSTLPSSMLSTL